jgi:hypothetical protein
MRPIHRFALLLPLLAACGEGPTDPGEFSLDGTWLGRGFPFELQLDLEQDGDNRVSGSGEVRGLEEILETVPDDDGEGLDTTSIDTVVTTTAAFDVGGDWDHPNFELRLRSEGYADAALAGAWSSGDSIRATLRESGFGNTTIVITRQTP